MIKLKFQIQIILFLSISFDKIHLNTFMIKDNVNQYILLLAHIHQLHNIINLDYNRII